MCRSLFSYVVSDLSLTAHSHTVHAFSNFMFCPHLYAAEAPICSLNYLIEVSLELGV